MAKLSKFVERIDNQTVKVVWDAAQGSSQGRDQTAGKIKDEHSLFTLFCTSCYGRLVMYLRAV